MIFHAYGQRGAPQRPLRSSASAMLAALVRGQIFPPARSPAPPGVDRPKIVTITFSVFLSRFTSSTTPLKLVNGPSLIRTCSPFSNMYFGFGFSAAVFTCVQNLLDLVLAERRRLRAGADEAGDLRRVLHHVPRVVGHVHLDQDVAGEEPLRASRPSCRRASPTTSSVGIRTSPMSFCSPYAFDALGERLGDLLLEARVGVDDVPVLRRDVASCCAPNLRRIHWNSVEASRIEREQVDAEEHRRQR